jgi:Tol biopolymer transport system component
MLRCLLLFFLMVCMSCGESVFVPTSPSAGRTSPGCPLGAPACWAHSSLKIVDANGAYVRTLALPNALYSDPSWSPDGSQIAMVRNGGDLIAVDVTTLRTRVLTSAASPGLIGSPTWSADGRSIAFILFPATTTVGNVSVKTQIDIIPSSGGAASRLEFGRAAAWSPDGRWIAVTTLKGVVSLIHPDGTGFRTLPVHGLAAWAPDSATLAIATDRRSIVSVPITGLGATTVVPSGQRPAWTPDGARITFLDFAKDSQSTIHVVNADGSNAHQLSSLVVHDFSWSPDGRSIIVTVPTDSGKLSVP